MSHVKQENSEYYMDSRDGQHGDYNQVPQSTQSPITAFLAKLWALVNDSSCDDLIAWDPSGASFHVYDQARFSREILPRYFKHNNFASFIRQLNMYGFRKMSTIEHGSLKNERDDIEFAHPSFIRGQESLLESIKRRAPDATQKSSLQGGRPVDLSHLLDDVRNLHTRQTSLSDKLSYMQNENQALWGEIGSLRQKHSKQQQIVSKLMEFLLHFINTNSVHHHDTSVEQHPPKEGITTDLLHAVQEQSGQHTNNSPLVLSEQGLSPNTLKRKHAAFMHGDQPNKRTTMQQQQQQQPPQYGRQQSVTINELSDHDAAGWLHTTNASPLVDLVPSPPPVQPSTEETHPQQQQQHQVNDYRWTTATTNDQRNLPQQNKNFQIVGNRNNTTNSYVPDFVLRTDNNPNGTTTQTNGANQSGITTSGVSPTSGLIKQEQTDLSNPTQQQVVDELKNHPEKAVEQLSFSLDDITGDVDHIQTSLDTIRDLMFDQLPDGTSIEDLFGEDHELLSPLLKTTSDNNNPTGNLFLESLQDQKPVTGDHQVEQNALTPNSQSVPNINNQLLEQLISEAVIVEEQQNTINQLAREKSDLENKIHLLEQQQQPQRK